MKPLLIFTFLVFSLTLSAQWKLIYEHDEKGVRTNGSKIELISAVESGAEVRVRWKESYSRNSDDTFTHFATAKSIVLTAAGEVYAELPDLGSFAAGRRSAVVIWNDGRRIPIISTQGQVEFKPAGESGWIRTAMLESDMKWFVRK